MKIFVRIALIIMAAGVLLMGAAGGAKADTKLIYPSKDNTLYEDIIGGLSNGAGEHLFVGRDMRGVIKRGAIAFDIAANIPAGSTVESVTLTMFVSQTRSSTNQLVQLLKFSNDWGEGTSNAADEEGQGAAATTNDVTWRNRFHGTGSFWINRGGDFLFSASGNSQVGAEDRFYVWESTSMMVADVQEWLDTPSRNFGWAIKGPEGTSGTTKRFDSKDNATAENRPVLTVEYIPGNRPRIFFGTSPGCADAENMVTIAADSTFGGQFYRYFFKPPGGNFQAIAGWGTRKTAYWLSSVSGVNIVVAQLSNTIDDPSPLRQMGGTYEVGGTDCQHPVYVTLSPASGIVNEMVTITAVAEGSNLLFRFFVRRGDFRPPHQPQAFTPMGDWTASNSFEFTPDTADIYTLIIQVTSDQANPGSEAPPKPQGGLVYVVGQ